ncbi:MAG: hypothetical protein AAB575_00720 [Patescibacteria group bacterium]
MPSTKGLKMFLRKEQLIDAEWFELIEERRELIKPRLDSFTLQELGKLECLRGEEGSYHAIHLDVANSCGDGRFSLKTQGLFYCSSASYEVTNCATGKEPALRFDLGFFPVPFYRDGIVRAWGLTRDNHWVLVTVTFIGESGYKNRGYDRAKEVHIIESDPQTISEKAKVEPKTMWLYLGEAVKRWLKRRENQYHQARDLAQMVETEELVYSTICKKE